MHRRHSITITTETDAQLCDLLGTDSLGIARNESMLHRQRCIGECALHVLAVPRPLREEDTWPNAISATALRAVCNYKNCPDIAKAEAAVIGAVYDALQII